MPVHSLVDNNPRFLVKTKEEAQKICQTKNMHLYEAKPLSELTKYLKDTNTLQGKQMKEICKTQKTGKTKVYFESFITNENRLFYATKYPVEVYEGIAGFTERAYLRKYNLIFAWDERNAIMLVKNESLILIQHVTKPVPYFCAKHSTPAITPDWTFLTSTTPRKETQQDTKLSTGFDETLPDTTDVTDLEDFTFNCIIKKDWLPIEHLLAGNYYFTKKKYKEAQRLCNSKNKHLYKTKSLIELEADLQATKILQGMRIKRACKPNTSIINIFTSEVEYLNYVFITDFAIEVYEGSVEDLGEHNLKKYDIKQHEKGYIAVLFLKQDFVFYIQLSSQKVPFFCVNDVGPPSTTTTSSWDFITSTSLRDGTSDSASITEVKDTNSDCIIKMEWIPYCPVTDEVGLCSADNLTNAENICQQNGMDFYHPKSVEEFREDLSALQFHAFIEKRNY
nr:uncharacterized protein LOC122270842 [Parasteatoda tepidariorum]